MKKRIGIILVSLVLVVFVILSATACKPSSRKTNSTYIVSGSVDANLMKRLSFNLDGVKALGLETRKINKGSATDSNGKPIAYADEVLEKEKLVGLKEDDSVIEVELKSKVGEIYKQDDIEVAFNKLYVSGNFVYFELIPETISKTNTGERLTYYNKDELDADGNPLPTADAKETIVDSREKLGSLTKEDGSAYSYIEEYRLVNKMENTDFNAIEDSLLNQKGDGFDKISRPNPVTGSFVYSLENKRIYDLSTTGYEIFADGLARIGNSICRTRIDENGEFEAKSIFNELNQGKVKDLRADKYGNVFGVYRDAEYSINYEDSENRVYIQKEWHSSTEKIKTEYWFDGDQAIKITAIFEEGDLHSTVDVQWIDENGLRELRKGDNFQDGLREDDLLMRCVWNGIVDGEALIYNRYSDRELEIDSYEFGMKVKASFGNDLYAFNLNDKIKVFFVKQISGAVSDAYGNFTADSNAAYAVWGDLSKNSSTMGLKKDEETGIYTVQGFNVIVDKFQERYPNAKCERNRHINRFTTKTKDSTAEYEFYWDEEEQTVKIRELEKYTAPPVEVRKFQPIG